MSNLLLFCVAFVMAAVCSSVVCRVDAFQTSRSYFGLSQTRTPSSSFALSMARGPPRRRQMPVKEVRPPMNEDITAPELRVVTPTPKGKDEALGIMTREQAMAKAKELGNLDLILVNNNSDPPVCKIVDYSKYRYMQEKKAKEVKKNSKATEIKEIKMSYKIDVHDYDVRKKNAIKFLRQGNRVKCTVMFRGREVQHDNLGFDLLDKLASELDDTCLKEGRPKREGRNLSMILSPRPEVLKAVNDQRRALDRAKKQKKRQEEMQQQQAEEEDEENDDDAVVVDEPKAAAPKREKTLEELLGTDEYL